MSGIMRILQSSLLAVAVFLAAACEAQQHLAEAPLQIPNPHYVTISESIDVDGPVEKVWAQVGRFCDITEWMDSPEWEDCKYLQGDGGPGSVRSIVSEVLVGQTQYSYTYAAASKGHAIQPGSRNARCRSSDPDLHATDLYDAAG